MCSRMVAPEGRRDQSEERTTPSPYSANRYLMMASLSSIFLQSQLTRVSIALQAVTCGKRPADFTLEAMFWGLGGFRVSRRAEGIEGGSECLCRPWDTPG